MSATTYAIVPRAEYLQGVDALGNAYGLCPFCAARVSLRWRGRCLECRHAHGDLTTDGMCIDCASTAHRAECPGHVDASTTACEIHISRENPPAVTVNGRHVWEPLDIDAAQRADVLCSAIRGGYMGVAPGVTGVWCVVDDDDDDNDGYCADVYVRRGALGGAR